MVCAFPRISGDESCPWLDIARRATAHALRATSQRLEGDSAVCAGREADNLAARHRAGRHRGQMARTLLPSCRDRPTARAMRHCRSSARPLDHWQMIVLSAALPSLGCWLYRCSTRTVSLSKLSFALLMAGTSGVVSVQKQNSHFPDIIFQLSDLFESPREDLRTPVPLSCSRASHSGF